MFVLPSSVLLCVTVRVISGLNMDASDVLAFLGAVMGGRKCLCLKYIVPILTGQF